MLLPSSFILVGWFLYFFYSYFIVFLPSSYLKNKQHLFVVQLFLYGKEISHFLLFPVTYLGFYCVTRYPLDKQTNKQNWLTFGCFNRIFRDQESFLIVDTDHLISAALDFDWIHQAYLWYWLLKLDFPLRKKSAETLHHCVLTFGCEGLTCLLPITAVMCWPAYLMHFRCRNLMICVRYPVNMTFLSYLQQHCANTGFVCWVHCIVSQLIRRTVQWIDFVQVASYWPYFSSANTGEKKKHKHSLIFFRNIFYRWCQRWNVQSVGPKERFFINRDKQQTKNNFFLKSIYM